MSLSLYVSTFIECMNECFVIVYIVFHWGMLSGVLMWVSMSSSLYVSTFIECMNDCFVIVSLLSLRYAKRCSDVGAYGLIIVQLSAVITILSQYYTWHCNDSCRTWIRLETHNRHPMVSVVRILKKIDLVIMASQCMSVLSLHVWINILFHLFSHGDMLSDVLM